MPITQSSLSLLQLNNPAVRWNTTKEERRPSFFSLSLATTDNEERETEGGIHTHTLPVILSDILGKDRFPVQVTDTIFFL
ncbi:Uncharacterized protein APZ42_002748, partial [Daphnia magna]